MDFDCYQRFKILKKKSSSDFHKRKYTRKIIISGGKYILYIII